MENKLYMDTLITAKTHLRYKLKGNTQEGSDKLCKGKGSILLINIELISCLHNFLKQYLFNCFKGTPQRRPEGPKQTPKSPN